MPKKISGYRVMAMDGRSLVGFSPRYALRPQDDTTTFGIVHKTIGGYVGVLLERGEFHDLAEWLRIGEPKVTFVKLTPFVRPRDETGTPVYVREIQKTQSQFRIIDGQSAAQLSRHRDGRVKVSAWWLGSGSGRSAVMGRIGTQMLTDWVTDIDAKGWEGWRSGRAEEA